MRSKRGYTLLELLTTICLIVILASAAVPMYSTATSRAKAALPVGAVGGVTQILQKWFQERGNFDFLDAPVEGGNIIDTNSGICIGTDLPCMKDVEWAVFPSGQRLEISWTFPAGSCPADLCDGKYCLDCSVLDGFNNSICKVAVVVGTNDKLGLSNTHPSVPCAL